MDKLKAIQLVFFLVKRKDLTPGFRDMVERGMLNVDFDSFVSGFPAEYQERYNALVKEHMKQLDNLSRDILKDAFGEDLKVEDLQNI